jgi:MFS family permease
MPVLTEEQKKEQARKISVREGSFTSLMDGFGSKYISPFALAVGATNSQIALLTSIPSLLGNFAQLGTLKLIRRFSRKKIVLAGVIIQAVLWLPLILVGWLYLMQAVTTLYAIFWIIAIYTLIIFAGAISSPAWSSWMKDILSAESGRYFSNRNKIITGVTLIGLLISGVIMDYFQDNNIFLGFTIIFSIAFLGRATAAYLFTKEYEPEYRYDKKSAFTLLDFAEHLTSNNFGRFVFFISLVSFSTAIAGPFFSVYMLRELNIDYFSYTLVLLSPIVATFVFLPIWGKFSDVHGNIRILRITGYLIPLVPILWMLTPFFYADYTKMIFYLFLIEMFGGFVWAGFNHATATFIYDAVSKEKMPYCIAYFHIITGAGAFLGAMLGGYIASLEKLPFGLTAIFATFLLSGILRLLSVLFVSHKIKEVKPVVPFSVGQSMKKHFEEETAVLTTQFWKLTGFKPVAPKQSMEHY